jgi:hypothetical protein
MTPLCRVQPSQIFLLKKQRVELSAKIFEKIWLHSGDNDTIVPATAVSMTLLCMSQWCQ